MIWTVLNVNSHCCLFAGYHTHSVLNVQIAPRQSPRLHNVLSVSSPCFRLADVINLSIATKLAAQNDCAHTQYDTLFQLPTATRIATAGMSLQFSINSIHDQVACPPPVGPVQNQAWSCRMCPKTSLLYRLNFVKRRGSSAAKIVVKNFDEIKQDFLFGVVKCNPSDHIWLSFLGFLSGGPQNCHNQLRLDGKVYLTNFCAFSTYLASPVNTRRHGTSRPPCTRSLEYLLQPVIWQSMVPPMQKYRAHSRKQFIISQICNNHAQTLYHIAILTV